MKKDSGSISDDEYDAQIADGLDQIKETHDDMKNAFAQNSNLSPQRKEKKVAEGLGKIKESYDHI